MNSTPAVMRLAQQLAAHSSARQDAIARNVANADTPGYRARDIQDFGAFVSQGRDAAMASSRAGHIESDAGATPVAFRMDPGAEVSPNGNSVSVEREMMKASEVRAEHDLALTVYKSSLNLMRSVIGRE